MVEPSEGSLSSSSSYKLLVAVATTTTADARWDVAFLVALLMGEAMLSLAIVRLVPYTEIDWQAYMEQVTTFQSGERDYMQIRGGTGPLVYPAGFLYLFAMIRHWTLSTSGEEQQFNDDTSIRKAQYIFVAFYLATQMAVWCGVYQPTIQAIRQRKFPWQANARSTDIATRSNSSNTITPAEAWMIWSWRIAMIFTCCSKRVHSIFVLRLFNDGPTMLLFYCALILFTRQRWNAGCFLFSLAVSVKMNVLLFAPGLLLLLLQASDNLIHVVYRLFVYCAMPQLILGAPFLLHHPIHYLRKAFELDRVFFYKWTVNWKFLPEDVFISKPLSVVLLALHIGGLVYFCLQWLSQSRRDATATYGAPQMLFFSSNKRSMKMSPTYIAATLLVSNYVGICFARTLHYQFYAWYFHSLPFLLWFGSTSALTSRNVAVEGNRSTSSGLYPTLFRAVLLVAIEGAFLTFPATCLSSATLQIAQLAILIQIHPPNLFHCWNEDSLTAPATTKENAKQD